MTFLKGVDIVMGNNLQMSELAKEVLKALAARKNVLLSGPPGTGKSRLLNEVRELFELKSGQTGSDPAAAIPLPPALSPLPNWFPSPDKTGKRSVYQTVFDQSTMHRDFMTGLVPKVGESGVFEVTEGTLYRAAEEAKEKGQASLVIIDEINRGPAVAVFGSTLVGLEADKRLPESGPSENTQYFEILNTSGKKESYALPEDLYILAAMNEADTSVEPLDVAFLRRFHKIHLEPKESILRSHFGLASSVAMPESYSAPEHIFEAIVRAFTQVNDQILIGRGPEYRLGHGALMHQKVESPDIGFAQEYAAVAWSTMRSHIEEVFFGNSEAIAEILQAGTPGSMFSIKEAYFAGQIVRRIVSPSHPSPNELYAQLKTMASTHQ